MKQQRGDFDEILPPDGVGMRARSRPERVVDLPGGEKFRELARALKEGIVFSATDPEKAQFLICAFGVVEQGLKSFLEIRRDTGAEGSHPGEPIEMAQADLQRLTSAH